MINFLIDSIFIAFGCRIFQHTVCIPLGTNCAPRFAGVFFHTYEAEFVQELLRKGDKKSATSFNYTFRCMGDVLSLNNKNFINFLRLIYSVEFVVKNTTDSPYSASYLGLYREHDINGTLKTKLYDKRDGFNFRIINFSFLDRNIPSSSAYGVCMSQLIRYSKTCNFYQDFLHRSGLLTRKLFSQGFLETRFLFNVLFSSYVIWWIRE